MLTGSLRERIMAWTADDPDPGDRAEVSALLAAADGGDGAAEAKLADRFAGRLRFGTAGLRAPVGAGPARINRAVVRAATAGVAAWLLRRDPAAAEAGVVVGCDARHRSRELADEAARVLAGAGIRAHLLAPEQPTPLLAFATTHLGAAAGIMVTASHNPAADNGYKLYVGDGAQITPPADAEVEAAIAEVGRLADVPLAGDGDPRLCPVGSEVVAAYLAAVAAAAPAPPGAGALVVVHTAMHGVAGTLFAEAAAAAGYPPPRPVAAQADPDPAFPTVAFPNPEEPGALDLALDEARTAGADVVVANDPDGDRVAVAVPEPAAAGGWRSLSGDELGAVLGAAVLAGEVGRPAPPGRQPVVASSLVSSSLLAAAAREAGVAHVVTLTGFKWIARAAAGVPGGTGWLAFGYEEALGYVVGDAVHDKDGIGAGLAVLALVAADRAAGRRPLLDRLDELEGRLGVHATRQVTRRLTGAGAPGGAGEVVARLRVAPPAALAGRLVTEVEDLAEGGRLPPTDGLLWRLEGARVVLRPSGTEPKLKAYLEVVRPPGGDLGAARASAAAELDELAAAVGALVGG